MWKKDVFEKDNGLVTMEEYIVKELIKENELSIGNLVGNIMTNYEVTNLSKIKVAIDNLLERNPFGIIEIVYGDTEFTYTKEKVRLSKIGKLYYIENEKLIIDYPISILRERKYKFRETEIHNVCVDRKQLYEYLKGNVKKEDLVFSKEFNRKYENEKEIIEKLLSEGKTVLSFQNGYNYIESISKLRIENKEIKVDLELDNTEEKLKILKSFGITRECEIIYLFKLEGETELELRSMEYILNEYKDNITKDFLSIYEKVILDDYREIEYTTDEDRDTKYLVFDKLTKDIYMRNFDLNTGEMDLIVETIDLKNKTYVVINENYHEKLDLFNLECDILKFKKDNVNIKGILGVCKNNKYNEVYFVSNKGDIKVMKEKDVIGRNRKIKGADLSEEVLINILHKRKDEKGLLMITENGFIKVLNLLEYKAKNKESKFVMGINLEEKDEVIFSTLIDRNTEDLILFINGEEKHFETGYLMSSRVNKGKKINITEKIKSVKLIERE